MPKFIDILRGSFGDTFNHNHAGVDPYWNTEGGWEENSRGDGMSYGGILETLKQFPGESDADFAQRAAQRAHEIEDTL